MFEYQGHSSSCRTSTPRRASPGFVLGWKAGVRARPSPPRLPLAPRLIGEPVGPVGTRRSWLPSRGQEGRAHLAGRGGGEGRRKGSQEAPRKDALRSWAIFIQESSKLCHDQVQLSLLERNSRSLVARRVLVPSFMPAEATHGTLLHCCTSAPLEASRKQKR